MALIGATILGAAGQVASGRLLRLSLGATWRPSAAALGAVSGVLIGPPGSVGELTLVNPTTLGVNPFVAVVQGTHATNQGQYEVPNDAYATLAITAQHASQFRRNLVAVTVDDSQAAGVTSSPTTDRARLHMIEGPLSATAPAPLPAVPQNTLLLGEVAIPPVGQTVTLTPYNPRTGVRGGMLPVFDDVSTLPGHGAEPGSYEGQLRYHPTRGAERWAGTGWRPLSTKLPTIRLYRIGSAAYNSTSVWAPIPYDGLDALRTHNPDNAYFTPNISSPTTERRLRVLQDGLYALSIESVGTGTTAGVRVARMTGPLALADGLVSNTGISASGQARLAAGDYIGGALLQAASDSPDGTAGYRNHLIVTRLGD